MPPWRSTLFLYHGTIGPHADDIRKKVDLQFAKPKRDFGKGFYTTRIRNQARRFAEYTYRSALSDHSQGRSLLDPIVAAVVEFHIDLGALADLDALAFVQATPDWRDFVRYCRQTGRPPRPNNKS